MMDWGCVFKVDSELESGAIIGARLIDEPEISVSVARLCTTLMDP